MKIEKRPQKMMPPASAEPMISLGDPPTRIPSVNPTSPQRDITVTYGNRRKTFIAVSLRVTGR
jgi:hypothetical protein